MKRSPRLSIIVPVYDVERYLQECLDSILGQDFKDFELIAVDDCSPDGCAGILSDYEQRDDRVRVLSLDKNVGLGLARNAGLEIARGDYVWFIDSDDVLRPRTMGKVMNRAEETNAEVVIFSWVRFFEDSTEKVGTGTEILAKAPAIFTASDCPQILRVLQVAWNKIMQRDLLERSELRFPEGYYEDTAFTYPLLASARSITTVPIAVVGYRQRTSGAITATRSGRHFEVLGQWAQAMTKMADLSSGDQDLRAELFPIMIRHCTYILMDGKRLPIDRQAEYMSRLSALAREHQPAGGYVAQSLGEKIELEIVKSGSLPLLKLYWGMRSAWWLASGRPQIKRVPVERRQISREGSLRRAPR
jgi:CDP-glycerol glycerophosphotransferase